jgi:hypothetical protein
MERRSKLAKNVRSGDFEMWRREVVFASRSGKNIQKQRFQLKMARPGERKTADYERQRGEVSTMHSRSMCASEWRTKSRWKHDNHKAHGRRYQQTTPTIRSQMSTKTTRCAEIVKFINIKLPTLWLWLMKLNLNKKKNRSGQYSN